jgi:hypothetical protein
MREIGKISEGLFEKIRDRFEDVSLGDAEANAITDPSKARFFNFDYTVEGKNYGNITISLVDEISLKVYFSKNITQNLDTLEKQKWYGFLKELREFSKRNMLSFEPRDITRPTLKHRDIKQVSKADDTFDKDDVLAEGHMYGTNRTSYENGNNVRIMVRHSDVIDPERRGARSRKIKSIFLETSVGERFKLPMNSLSYARAMARHIAEGGTMHDDFGQHISNIAEECGKLRPFRAAMSRRVFEDEETQGMVEAAFEYHGQLKHTLSKMSGAKGYKQCKEEFAVNGEYISEEDVDVASIKERFVKRVFNDRMEDALPIVQKAYNMKKENKYAKQFESWASNVVEGTWAVPDSEESISELIELFANELPLGVDAVNATSALYNIIGDDTLFDLLGDVAEEEPDADARPIVLNWLESNMPEVYQQVQQAQQEPSDGIDHELGSELAEATAPKKRYRSLKNWHTAATAQGATIEKEEVIDTANYYVYHAKKDGEEIGFFDNFDNLGYLQLSTEGEQIQEDEWDDANNSVDSIVSAITNRILRSHSDLLRKVGPEKLLALIQDEAEYAAPVDEIGSSDVSAWVNNIYQAVNMEPQLSEDSSKPFGLRYKMFAGRDERIVTKERWFASEEQRERFATKIQDDGKFYEIDSYGSLNEDEWDDRLTARLRKKGYSDEEQAKMGTVDSSTDGSDIDTEHDNRLTARLRKKGHEVQEEGLDSNLPTDRQKRDAAKRSQDEKWARHRADDEKEKEEKKEVTEDGEVSDSPRVWGVRIRNNYYAGKYYDYSSQYYPVIASNEAEAIQVVLQNADAVLQDMMTKKTRTGRKLVSPSHPVKITDKSIIDAKPFSLSTVSPRKFFTPTGVQELTVDNGTVVDTASATDLAEMRRLAGL